MTAAELASFRALLHAQASSPPSGVDQGLFARMRARLTVVEGGGEAAEGPSAPPPRLEVVADVVREGRPADPPPSRPPAFGRREGGPPPRLQPALALEDVVTPPPSVRRLAPPCTPDELADVRDQRHRLRHRRRVRPRA